MYRGGLEEWIKVKVLYVDLIWLAERIRWLKGTIGDRGKQWDFNYSREIHSVFYQNFIFKNPEHAIMFKLKFGGL
jgi:hypothetical protein